MAVLPLYSLVAIFNNYQFLLTQEKNYVEDTKEAFHQSGERLEVIFNEIDYLMMEHADICKKIPKIFDLGFIKVDSSEYFDKVKKVIESYIDEFKKCKSEVRYLQFVWGGGK